MEAAEILQRLKASDLWTKRTREKGKHVTGLRCPSCGKPEAWCYSKAPFVVICPRKNNCGALTKTMDLFPDLLQNIERDHPATEKDPDAPAREYLRRRGLSKSLDGLQFKYKPNVRKTTSGAVMFPVAEKVWNGRLFNPPAGEGKTHNVGRTAGRFWRHPGLNYDPDAAPIYVTEGIIDALSLIEMGHQAIAVLSASADPASFDLGGLQNNLVVAFDPDAAGAGGLKKWKAAYPKAGAITSKRGDWNDFLLAAGTAAVAAEQFKGQLPEFKTRAGLLLAESAEAYAQTYFDFYDHAPGLFTFNRRYFYCYAKTKSDNVELVTTRCSNFTVSVEHYQLDATNPEEPNHRFHLRVKPAKQNGSKPITCTASSIELATADAMTKTFLSRAKVLWEGTKPATTALLRRITEAGAPTIRQLQLTGYDEQTRAYVFQHFAVSAKGDVVPVDRDGFIKLAVRELVRPARHATLKPEHGMAAADLYRLLLAAWGERAAVAVAWTCASWFVRQVKPELGFFPFLSLHGDPQTGKTRLVRLLNAMQCIDEEGLPLHRVNTGKGEIRKIAQRAGLFKAVLEGNRERQTKFDYDTVLPLYNENPLQVRAKKTTDIQTEDVPFLSSLCFIQNREPFTSRAQKERFISVRFQVEDITPETTEAFNQAIAIPPAQVAAFFIAVMQHRQTIEQAWRERFEKRKAELRQTVPDPRISENHALVWTFHDLLTGLLGVEVDLQPFISRLAADKVSECEGCQNTLADEFFSALASLEAEIGEAAAGQLYEVKQDGTMALRMPEVLKAMHEQRFDVGRVGELHAALKEHPAFIKSNHQYRGGFSGGERVRVWLFDSRKL